jgi:hypothetical protein
MSITLHTITHMHSREQHKVLVQFIHKGWVLIRHFRYNTYCDTDQRYTIRIDNTVQYYYTQIYFHVWTHAFTYYFVKAY